MNPIIELLRRHRSIRKFKPDPLTPEQIEAILRAAQSASTSSNVQAYSVVNVTDPALRKKLRAVAADQAYVEQCPLFLVWCADMYRLRLACEKEGVRMAHDTMENFIVATVDTALAAQNAAVAAESMGLGVVYIGSIRNDAREAARLLNLPELVYPVFGMCIGYPDHEPMPRPRLPLRAILHENGYNPSALPDAIDEYDATMRQYYAERTKGRRDTTWSKEMADKFRQPLRDYMRAFLEEQGFRFER